MRQGIDHNRLTDFEPMIEKALAFSGLLLQFADTFYPFALLSVGGTVQPVVTEDNTGDEATTGLIETLDWLIWERSFQSSGTASVRVHMGELEIPGETPFDVVIVNIRQQQGQESQRFYPVVRYGQQVIFAEPFVC